MQEEMQAVTVKKFGSAEKMILDSFPKPHPSENEILVKVEATALNRADILQREGKYPPPKGASPIMGLELAGSVVELGESVEKWNVGDRIFGLLPGGGYAEYALIHQDMALPVPEGMSTVEAAAIPEVFLTAFQALQWLGKLKENETVLIHAGASGVGTAAIQLAKQMGAKILVTASEPKHNACLKLGADRAIDYKNGPFKDKILDATDGAGVDVIIDFIAGPYFNQNISCLKQDGRLVILATLGGGKTDECDLRKILVKRLTIMGSTLRSRDRDYQIKLTKEFADFALTRFKNGTLKPVIDKVFTWNKVVDAHKYMEANKNIGKIVLKIV
jgi:putative PIG3 family NAD(P)H quinone oxidoreductase